jgi:MGT family glycosyltransferase
MVGTPAVGHVNPSLALVRELVRRNIQVTYYTDEDFRAAVEGTGARWHPYPPNTISARDIAEATRTGGPLGVVAQALPAVETLVPFLVGRLRAQRPDAVAFDSNAIWGRMAASSLDLPKISFMTTLMLGTADFKRLTAREWMASLLPMLADLPRVLRARRRVVRRFGKHLYPPAPTLPMRGDVTIFPIPPEFQPSHPLIDEHCHFVGPMIDPARRDETMDAELATHLGGSEPVVLVSLGTLHAGTDDFFRGCFTVLADLPARIVLAVGSNTDSKRIGRPPANMLVRQSVPQLGVLARAAVFVTHGGMNSVLEGLANGVPLVVLPQQVEQLAIGFAVAERGAAVVLRHNLSNRPVPPAELRAAVDRALTEPSQRAAAKAMADNLFVGGGAAAAGEVIQDFLATRR